MRVMVMAGTSDAVNIISKLADLNYFEVIATTTTKYGSDLAQSAGANEVIVGRLGVQEITDLIRFNDIDLLVDATHPFAVDASINAIKSTKNSGINYLRYERPSVPIPKNDHIIQVESFEEAALESKRLIKSESNGKIMYLAGVSTLHHITGINPELIIVRVLPVVYSVKKCIEMGIPTKNILAMQGTFSKEFNKALMKEYNIKIVVTKESGESGGTPSKMDAALELGITMIIINRPHVNELDNEIICNDVDELIKKISFMAKD